ncbi:unnamed protein product [Peniophora sp. CBMAI 1063]|nr:unnamed protein product [Peniophora sp. CBMAI 1063]
MAAVASSHKSSTQPRDEENAAEYNTGGYLQVKVGDSFKDGRYAIVRKLGWGHFSTVWLVRDSKEQRHCALKVVKSASRYAETARDEIKLLKQIQDTSPAHHGRAHVVSFLDSFSHTAPSGQHVCMTFEPLGENLLALIEKNRRKGVAPCLVKCIARQLLLGLQYLHEECDLVHTDIKPENILMSIPDVEAHIADELSSSPTPQTYKLAIPPAARRRSSALPSHALNTNAKSVQICESQPLRSPSRTHLLSSSSSGSISSLAFTPRSPVSAGAGTALTTPSTSLGSAMSKLKLSPPAPPQSSDDDERNMPTVVEVEVPAATPGPVPVAGPSLLSQTAPTRQARSASRANSAEPASRDSSLSSSSTAFSSVSSAGNSQPIAEAFSPCSIKIADLGNATPSTRHYTEDIQTRQYRSPEAILGRSDWGAAVDVWSAACVVFELLTAEYLFEPQGQGTLFSKDDDHMAQIIELLGELAPEVRNGGRYSRELFDSNGQLRYIKHLKPWPLSRVMREKYLFAPNDADALCAFLEPMLMTDFRARVSAGEAARHPWLDVDWEREIGQLEKVNW